MRNRLQIKISIHSFTLMGCGSKIVLGFFYDVVLNFPLMVVLLSLARYFSCLDTSIFQGVLLFQKETNVFNS